ncbi:MAG: hypothetical protein AAFZ52_03135 [Bacteroidota bacterium]
MNTSPDLDQLFTLTQQLPTEMELTHVEHLIIGLPSTSSGLPRWLFLSGGLLVCLSLWWFFPERSPRSPRLAGTFPTHRSVPTAVPQIPALPALMLDVPPQETALPLPTVGVHNPPLREQTSPRPYPAPAAAPPTLPRPDPAPPQVPVYGAPTITGDWHFDERTNRLSVSFRERVNKRKIDWRLTVALTEAELRGFFPQYETTDQLDRETGRLQLRRREANLAGEFAFQPRLDALDRYEGRGWGTEAVPATKVRLSGMSRGLSNKPELVTNRPAAVLWFRYFLVDTDAEYFSLLDTLGVDEDERTDLWRLANRGITKKTLRLLHGYLDGLLVPKALDLRPTDIVRLYRYERLFQTLRQQGYQNLQLADLRALTRSLFSFRHLEEINRYRSQRFTVAEITELWPNQINFSQLHAWQRAVTRDLSVDEVLRLKYAGVTAFDAVRFSPPNGDLITAAELIRAKRENGSREEGDTLRVGPDFGRRKAGFKASKVELSDFCRLVVGDNIRVVVIPGEKNKAELVVLEHNALDVELKERRDCELRIRKKERFGFNFRNRVLAEVRLTAKRLRELEIKGSGEVWVVGDTFDLCDHCDQPGRAVLEE